MRSTEPVLRTMRTQVLFDVARVAAEVAQAAALSARAQDYVTTLMHRCESVASELRVAMARSRINPAVLDTMRRIYHGEQLALGSWQARLDEAQQREQQARTVLADLRNRERSLERALQAERRKRQMKQQAVEMARADEMWLQHAWRELS